MVIKVFSGNIYSLKSIQETSGAFSEICSVRTVRQGADYALSFTDFNCDPVLLVNEFENYLIVLTCKKQEWHS